MFKLCLKIIYLNYRWVLTLTMTNMWYPDPNLNRTFTVPAWTVTTLTAFYLVFPPILAILKQISSHQLTRLIVGLFFWQLLSAFLFFNQGSDKINHLIYSHPLLRCFSCQTVGHYSHTSAGYQCLWWGWLQAWSACVVTKKRSLLNQLQVQTLAAVLVGRQAWTCALSSFFQFPSSPKSSSPHKFATFWPTFCSSYLNLL